MCIGRLLQCVDIREQNLFLFLHVHDHLSPDFGEESLDVCNFGVILSVLCFTFVQQCLNPGDCLTNVPMVPLTDMPCQISQRCRRPVFRPDLPVCCFHAAASGFPLPERLHVGTLHAAICRPTAIVDSGIFENLPGRWIRKRNVFHLGFVTEIHNRLRTNRILEGEPQRGSDQSHYALEESERKEITRKRPVRALGRRGLSL